MGVNRSINDERSGRSFLQDWAMSDESSIGVGHFFETLKSSRRLQLIEEVNTTLAGSMPSHPDSLIDTLEELGGIDIYAGDGHYHAAGVHDAPIKGKRRAVGHFYTLNYRTHALTHLTAADLQGGRKKSEHDMHALKRMSSGQLRQGAAKGRQVLYVWDCAGTDMRQWYKWKQAAGVYFLSRAKDLMKITCYGEIEFDREDPINAGVLADQHAATETTGVMMRYIRYQCPRYGTLWADRFKSVLVEGSGNPLQTMAAYIDLNSVRAGLVEDPKDYRFCGYAEAVAGASSAVRGLKRIWADHDPDPRGPLRAHRLLLFGKGASATSGGKATVIGRDKALEVLEREDGALPRATLLRCRVRYFSDGAILGSAEFVRGFTGAWQRERGRKRPPKVNPLVGGDWGDLVVIQSLRRSVFT